MNFYELLTELCYSKGISPSKLCKDIGLSNATATKWKHGAKPSEKTILLLANYFGMKPTDFACTLKTIDMIKAVKNLEMEVEAEQLKDENHIKKTNHCNRVFSAYINAPLHIKKAILMLLEIEEEIENCTVFDKLCNFDEQIKKEPQSLEK